MFRNQPSSVRNQPSPDTEDEQEQVVQRARRRLAEWEAEQETMEKFQQARLMVLGQSDAEGQGACCADCAEHDHRVRTRYAAHLEAMREDSDDID